MESAKNWNFSFKKIGEQILNYTSAIWNTFSKCDAMAQGKTFNANSYSYMVLLGTQCDTDARCKNNVKHGEITLISWCWLDKIISCEKWRRVGCNTLHQQCWEHFYLHISGTTVLGLFHREDGSANLLADHTEDGTLHYSVCLIRHWHEEQRTAHTQPPGRPSQLMWQIKTWQHNCQKLSSFVNNAIPFLSMNYNLYTH